MMRKPISQYYWLGISVRYVHDAQAGYRVGSVNENLLRFYTDVGRLGLQVTEQALSELDHLSDELGALDKDDVLSEYQAGTLREAIGRIRPTLEAELRLLEAFVVTPKRLDDRKLLDDVPAMLARGAYEKLPAIAQSDLREAGKCTAFERPTAAAFHLMRATEAVLKAFYCRVVRRNRGQFMWGPMTKHLRERRDAKQHGDLLNHLDHIRRSFRNPTQHPEKTYDMDEVQDLWGLCVDALNRMGKGLA